MKKYAGILLSLFILLFASCSNLNLAGQKNGEVSFDVAEIVNACSPVLTKGISAREIANENVRNYIDSLIKYDASFTLTEEDKVVAEKQMKFTLLQLKNAANKKSEVDSKVTFDSIQPGKKIKANIEIKLDVSSLENIREKILEHFSDLPDYELHELMHQIENIVSSLDDYKQIESKKLIKGSSDEITISAGENTVVVNLSAKKIDSYTQSGINIEQPDYTGKLHISIEKDETVSSPYSAYIFKIIHPFGEPENYYDSYTWEYSYTNQPYAEISINENGHDINGNGAFYLESGKRVITLKYVDDEFDLSDLVLRCTAHVRGTVNQYDNQIIDMRRLENF